jgi:hypothetical protein
MEPPPSLDLEPDETSDARVGEGLSVLVVEDDPDLRRSIQRVLLLDGYDVEVARSSEEVLAASDLDGYFAILLDLRLPDGESTALFDPIRRRAPHANMLVITAHVDVDSALHAIRKGVDDYLVKPIRPDALRSRLASLAELYRVRAELRESESRMRFLVENMPVGAVYVHHDRLYFNQAVEKLIGFREQEIETIDQWFSVLCGDRGESLRQYYLEAQDAGFPEPLSLSIRRRDGVTCDLEIAGYHYDHRAIWIVMDRTELLAAQRKLVQNERLAAIGQMVAGLAHESRNALQRARGCLDLLELDLAGRGEQLDLTSRIRGSLDDLQRLYEEVKNYAAPINLRRDEVDLVGLIRRTFDDLSGHFSGAGHRLVISAPDPPPRLRADSHRLKQVFCNLFENSVAASPQGADIAVAIETKRSDEVTRHVIRVSDRGEGMSSETVRRLFEPFYTTKQHGTGLGMAICQRIVMAHGGAICIDSSPGEGTTVTMELPEMSGPPSVKDEGG